MPLSTIDAQFNSSGNLRVTGVGSARIRLRLEWSDNPNTFGDAINSISVNGMTFRSPGSSGSDGQSAIFTPGTYNVSYNGLLRPLIVNNNSVKMRDNQGEDTNALFSIENINQQNYEIPGCTDPRANNYNSSATQNNGTCTYTRPTVSISASPTTITRGQSSTLSWSTSGPVDSVSINQGVGNVGTSGNRSVSPFNTTTYTITATGPGGSASASATVTVRIPGCTDPRANNYNSSATVDNGTCTYDPPSISFSLNKTTICPGNTATLSWSVTNATSISITNIGSNRPSSGSVNVSPSSTTTYILTATGLGGTRTASQTLTRLENANTTISASRTTIVRGESTTLTWNTTGNSTYAMLTPGVGPTNNSSYLDVSPTVTTTYTISVTGDCLPDSDQVTITVLQPPSVDLSGPVSVNYGSSVNLIYSAQNAVTSLYIQPTYFDTLNNTISGQRINLTTGESIPNTNIIASVPWNDFGPKSLEYRIEAEGYGGLTTSETIIIPVNIDMTPDSFSVPDSDDKLKNEEPIVSPDIEITSEEILITDIDIPVEIKSNKPIQVDINDSETWTSIREL